MAQDSGLAIRLGPLRVFGAFVCLAAVLLAIGYSLNLGDYSGLTQGKCTINSTDYDCVDNGAEIVFSNGVLFDDDTTCATLSGLGYCFSRCTGGSKENAMHACLPFE